MSCWRRLARNIAAFVSRSYSSPAGLKTSDHATANETADRQRTAAGHTHGHCLLESGFPCVRMLCIEQLLVGIYAGLCHEQALRACAFAGARRDRQHGSWRRKVEQMERMGPLGVGGK